jgi:transcriptional regulator with XRE-family HTH domain
MIGFKSLIDFTYVATGWSDVTESSDSDTTGATMRRVATVAVTALTVLSIALSGGSGAVSPSSGRFVDAATSSRIIYRIPRGTSEPKELRAEAIDTPTRLNEVRARLSLNMRQLASALHVGRPALYRWYEGVTPNDGNLRRIKDLYDIAVRWSKLSSSPVGKNLVTPIGEGGSLVSLLSATQLEEERINRLLTTILRSQQDQIDRRARSGYRSPSSIIAERGYRRSASDLARQQTVDVSDL